MTSYQDFSGFGYNATQADGIVVGPDPLATAAGCGGNSLEASNDFPVIAVHPLLDADGRLPSNYSYEAWVYVFGEPEEQQIYGLADETTTSYLDGLTIEGTVVRWRVKYDNEDDTVLEWDTKYSQRLYIAGTHSQEKDELWINGSLVLEYNSTDEQKADTSFVHDFFSTQIGLTIEGDGTQKLDFNAVAVYATVLPPEVIERHWNMGTNFVSSESIVNNWGGEKYDLHASGTEVFLDFTWTTVDDWNLGHMNGIRIVEGELRPHIVDGASVGGTWLRNIYLANAGEDTIASINFDWDGFGVTVEVSLDGSTWEEIVEGQSISLVPSGFDPTDKNLYLRVTFDDGSTDDEQYLDNIHVVGVRTQSKVIYGRTITIEGHRLRNYEPMEQNDLWGVRLDSGDTVTISPDVDSEPGEVHAIEIWVKDVDGDFPVLNAASSADFSTISNDEGNEDDALAGHWYRLMYAFTDSFDTNIIISGPGQVGFIALYSEEWDFDTDPTKYLNQYMQYQGASFQRVFDDNDVTLSQNVEKTRVYAEDWVITAS